MRAAGQRLIGAHMELLKAELDVAKREAAIIAALAGVAFGLSLLLGTLLFVGTWLFLGEWLFGSMGWGILHGTLFTLALIVAIGLNLAGAKVSAWVRAFVIALVVSILVALLFASNVLRNSAVALGERLQGSLALDPAALPVLTAIVVGALVFAVLFLLVGARAGGLRGGLALAVAGLFVGALLGAILGAVTFDLKGAIAVALTVGLILWMALAGILAARAGIDPKARYEKLIPRDTIAELGVTRAYLVEQWQRQRKKLIGR